MWQKSYALYYVLKNVSEKTGLGKVYLRFFSSGYYDLLLSDKVIKVSPELFDSKGALTQNPIKSKHPAAVNLNNHLNTFKLQVGQKLLVAKGPITKDFLEGRLGSSDRITDFIEDFVADKREEWVKYNDAILRGIKKQKPSISEGRLKIYMVISGKISEFSPKATFSDVSEQWLEAVQKHIADKDISASTVSSNMRVLMGILTHAKKAGLIDAQQYEKYTPPGEIPEIPEFFDEQEIDNLFKVTKAILSPIKKMYGYHFLLGCYAGYRLSDIMSFNYHERVKANRIILRAKKNGAIVSIPLFPRLKEVAEYCRDNPFSGTEQLFRDEVKELAKLAGIRSSRIVKVHTARHSFAMMMMDKGLTKEEVAELIGDTPLIASIYARVMNSTLSRKVSKAMRK